jgi:hypothetical protein
MGESHTDRLIYIDHWHASVRSRNLIDEASCLTIADIVPTVGTTLDSFIASSEDRPIFVYHCRFVVRIYIARSVFYNPAVNGKVIKTIKSRTPWKSPIMDEAPGPPFNLYECVSI